MKVIQSLIAVSSLLASASVFAQSATSDEIRATVAEVMADAETRSSLLAAGDAGHDGKFFIAGDGFRLNVGGDLRFRYAMDFNRSHPASDSFESGFEVPLARIRFNGNIANDWTFAVTGSFANDSDGSLVNDGFNLEDAWIGTSALGGNFRFGQFRLPFMAEVSADEREDLAVSRSVTSDIFGQGRSQGVSFTTNLGSSFRLTGAFSDGFHTANTNFDNPNEADYGLTGRLDWKAIDSGDNSLNVGGAFHYQDGGTQNRFYTYTGDLSYNSEKFSALFAGVGRNIEDSTSTYNDFGVMGQAAYRVTQDFEPFARYDGIFADGDRNLSNDTFNFVSAGFNYYLAGKAVKFTSDVVWALDSTEGLTTLGDFSNTNLLGSSSKDEVAVRFQFQLLF